MALQLYRDRLRKVAGMAKALFRVVTDRDTWTNEESTTEALALLRGQHRQVEGLFLAITRAESPVQKRKLFQSLAQAITIHATLEERHFYPAVRAPETESLLDESLQEHKQVRSLIAQIERLGESAPAFSDKIRELERAVEHHAREEEEKKLFPQVEKLLSEDYREALGQEMVATMVEIGEVNPKASRAGRNGHPVTSKRRRLRRQPSPA